MNVKFYGALFNTGRNLGGGTQKRALKRENSMFKVLEQTKWERLFWFMSSSSVTSDLPVGSSRFFGIYGGLWRGRMRAHVALSLGEGRSFRLPRSSLCFTFNPDALPWSPSRLLTVFHEFPIACDCCRCLLCMEKLLSFKTHEILSISNTRE